MSLLSFDIAFPGQHSNKFYAHVYQRSKCKHNICWIPTWASTSIFQIINITPGNWKSSIMVCNCWLKPIKHFSNDIMLRTNYIRWDDQTPSSIILMLSSLEHQSTGRQIAPFGALSWFRVFALTHSCCMLIEKATNINIIVFGLIRPCLEQTIYSTQDSPPTIDAFTYISWIL